MSYKNVKKLKHVNKKEKKICLVLSKVKQLKVTQSNIEKEIIVKYVLVYSLI